MWEKGTGFTFRPPFLWRSSFIWVCCSACDDLRPFLLMLSTGNKTSSHSVLLSSISLFTFFISIFFISLSAGSVRQEQKRRWLRTWRYSFSQVYIQKDYIFHNCCSGSFSVVFSFLFFYIYLSSWTVYCQPFTHQFENILLIIDKLQQYQYNICLYSRFKDNFVVNFFFKFQIWMKKETKKYLVMLYSLLLFYVLACTFKKWNINIQMFQNYIYKNSI